nr:hypothetical protein [Abalone asfa-like virus]
MPFQFVHSWASFDLTENKPVFGKTSRQDDECWLCDIALTVSKIIESPNYKLRIYGSLYSMNRWNTILQSNEFQIAPKEIIQKYNIVTFHCGNFVDLNPYNKALCTCQNSSNIHEIRDLFTINAPTNIKKIILMPINYLDHFWSFIPTLCCVLSTE